ncbi:hypothetical protein [Allopusillimonas ginsengisoli]|uniref:hypothetical protein n=1 Tax=Allopusillimonas ginsengisoli TaxID=453575 RepID=UPI0014305D25|nr:hypothetical protein [Allopusillimonas ginsengisoli]
MDKPSHSVSQTAQRKPRRSWRVIGWIALTLVIALAFVGYLTPDMRVQWANLAALCGF